MKNVARATRPEMVTHLFLHQLSHNATPDINAAVTTDNTITLVCHLTKASNLK
jgi:hypothetical protein